MAASTAVTGGRGLPGGLATVARGTWRFRPPTTSPGSVPPSNREGWTIRLAAGVVSRFDMTWLFDRRTTVSSSRSHAQPPSVPAETVASGPMLDPPGTGRCLAPSGTCASGGVISITSVRTDSSSYPRTASGTRSHEASCSSGGFRSTKTWMHVSSVVRPACRRRPVAVPTTFGNPSRAFSFRS